MTIKEQLEGLYFYSFTSGSYDSYSFDGMYASHNLVTQSMWYDHLEAWNAERNKLANAIPLKEVTILTRTRTIRDMDTPEAQLLREHAAVGAERSFILKHGLVAIEETEDFHRD